MAGKKKGLMIPSSFPIMGTRVRVLITSAPEWLHGDDTLGVFLPVKGVIEIRDDVRDDVLEHTFLHELVHAILYSLNHKLKNDEAFVDTFSGLLHPALSGANPKR